MTEVIGDVVIPSELVLPQTTTNKTMSGQIFVSGTRICWFNGSVIKTLTED